MTARRAALMCWAFTVAIAVPSLVLLALGPGQPVPNEVFGGAGGVSFIVLSLAFATVGAIVAARVPGNRIGWVFCLTGLCTGVGTLAYQYADYGLNATADALPGAQIAAWVPSEGTAGLLALPLLLFPDGRLPSRRWRPAVAMALLGIALLVAASALRPGPFDDPFAEASNPFGIPGARAVTEIGEAVGWGLALGAIALGAAALVTRLRRARGIERQQLKVVLAGSAVAASAALGDMVTWIIWPEGHLQIRMAVMGLSFALFPVVAGVGILRYRLYDIDVVINRALVYAALTAILAAAYVGSVLLLQLALSPSSDLAIAASTLAVAALFRPARSRVQAVVDRRFYRHRYDARHTLEAFSARLRDQVDLDALSAELQAVVTETMQPAHASLWIKEAVR